MAGKTFPVTVKQLNLLDCLADPGCSAEYRDHFLLVHAVLVHPRVDQRRLARAAGLLLQRHDSLRIKFSGRPGAWRAFIPDPAPAGIVTHTLDVADDGEFLKAVTHIARQPHDVLRDPLAEFVLIKCGTRGDVVISRVHHTVADGIGMILLVEELMKALLGMPLLGKALSHAGYLADWEHPKGKAAAANAAYWRDYLEDAPPLPAIGRKAKGLAPLVKMVGWTSMGRCICHAAPVDHARINAAATAAAVSVDMIVYAAFARAICRKYDVHNIFLMSPVARIEPGLATFCGDRNAIVYLIYRDQPEHLLSDLARQLHRDLIGAMAHTPDPAVQPGSAIERGLIDAGCYPRQFMAKSSTPAHLSRKSRNGLNSATHGSFKLGQYTLEMLDVSSRALGSTELCLDMPPPGGEGVFNLGFDTDAYHPDEIADLAARTAKFLGIGLTLCDIG